jgi:hypothetical protein
MASMVAPIPPSSESIRALSGGGMGSYISNEEEEEEYDGEGHGEDEAS